MTVCNVCGKETPTGSYVLIDGKPVCFNCSPKDSDDDLSLFNVREKIKPKKIVCPYCNEGYSPDSKKCPKCKGPIWTSEKADKAIAQLKKDTQVSWEDLIRPVTI